MVLDYIVSGDYLLPAIKLSNPPDAPPLGLYTVSDEEQLKRLYGLR
jgi:hypothetical protein